jgi:hypothetical protein
MSQFTDLEIDTYWPKVVLDMYNNEGCTPSQFEEFTRTKFQDSYYDEDIQRVCIGQDIVRITDVANIHNQWFILYVILDDYSLYRNGELI